MVNDVVLLKEESVLPIPRSQWPMGRVVEVHPSHDGMVRSVTLSVGGTVLKRPIHKLVLLVPAEKLVA